MLFLYELFPVFLFFITFKFYGIYAATVIGMVATLLQTLCTRWWKKNWDKKQIITLGVFTFFGSLTLYFHNPIFVKWKPTVVFWIFSLIIIVSHFATKPLIQHLMENLLDEKEAIPHAIWRRLNIVWAIFFVLMGSINLYIAYFFSNETWVNFKFYGITAALFILTLGQTIYLMRYLSSQNNR
jgi:intracellular septation protein